MPRGKYVNHKGRNRHFTSPEELEAERKNEEKKKKWRNTHDGSSEDEDGSDDESSNHSDEESEEEVKKGASSVIEVHNPNRVQKKPGSLTEPAELSRREREEIEKQKAYLVNMQRHAEGKTEQAKADLARLAIIKQHRAEAAARREAEKKAKEAKGGK